jgi:hypothetical protein
VLKFDAVCNVVLFHYSTKQKKFWIRRRGRHLIELNVLGYSTLTSECVAFIKVSYLARIPPPPPSGPWPHWRGFYITYDTPHSVGLVLMSDQLVAEICTWPHITVTTDFHAPGGIGTHNLSRWAADELRLRRRGYRDRLINFTGFKITANFECKSITQDLTLQPSDINTFHLILNSISMLLFNLLAPEFGI